MANKNFKFNIDKAYELRLTYHEKRQYAKEQLISQIILWYNFREDFIVESTISVVGHYQYRTVKAVCDDLGYNLGYMNHSPIKGLYGKEYGSFTNLFLLSHIQYLGGGD